MRIIEIEEYGSASKLRLGNRQTDLTPGDGEVRVAVKAASYNPVDSALREGSLDPISARSFPQGQGLDWAGVIDFVGPGVSGWSVGDEVIGCQPAADSDLDASWAERLRSKVDYMSRKPDGVSWEEAAGLPLVGMTALQALRDEGGLQVGKGMNVLVNGASGGVGHVAIQIARLLGAEKVVGTASSEHLDFVRELGADEAVDYDTIDTSRYAETFDIYFDAAAKLDFSTVKGMLKPEGVYVRTRPTLKTVAEAAATKVAGLVGYGKQSKVIWMSSNARDLSLLSEWVSHKRLRVVVARTFDFEEYRAFVEAAEASSEPGKYVLMVDREDR